MYNTNKILAIIPARGGSKRLPRKNYKELCGKPLIEWTIKAARESKYIDDVIVSSDDSKVLEIARRNGVIEYQRNEKLSTDEASSVDVVIDVIDSLDDIYNIIMLLQPTSPLRSTYDIDSAIETFYFKKADAVISVCESDHPVQWMNTLPENYSMVNFLSKEIQLKRSQDFDTYYRLNGAIYIIKPLVLRKQRTFYIDKNVYAYVMPRERSIDIDERIDFKLAEVLLEEMNGKK